MVQEGFLLVVVKAVAAELSKSEYLPQKNLANTELLLPYVLFASYFRTTDDFYLFLLLLELFFFQGSLAAKRGEEGKL